MDNREAKFILSAYRPSGRDASDAHFTEAVEQARRDPILQRWFEESIAFDASMTEGLRAITPPADLRDNILAGVKISRISPSKNRFAKWAIAAALVVSASLAALLWQSTRPPHLAGWQNASLDTMSSLVRNESSFDAQSRNVSDLLVWLSANHAPAAEKVPSNLAKLQSLGCKTFSWKGVPVSVICFMRSDGGLIHLVTTNVSPSVDHTLKREAKFIQQGEWTTATWREGDKVYMLALEGSRHQLQGYL